MISMFAVTLSKKNESHLVSMETDNVCCSFLVGSAINSFVKVIIKFYVHSSQCSVKKFCALRRKL